MVLRAILIYEIVRCILNIDPNYTISVATPLGTGILTVKLTWPRDGTCPPQTLYFQLDPHKSIKRCLPFKIPQIDEMFLIGQ